MIMQNMTELLENESGLQYDGVDDQRQDESAYPDIGLMVGRFKRGCYNKPMTITKNNQRAMLGYDPRNPYYAAVEDALETGVNSVQVLRLADAVNTVDEENPTGNEGGENTSGNWDDSPVILEKFDFAILRYIWTSAGGRDLDTRTYISSPARNVVVGWNKNNNDDVYLQWGGDNTGSGVESVLMRVKDLMLA